MPGAALEGVAGEVSYESSLLREELEHENMAN